MSGGLCPSMAEQETGWSGQEGAQTSAPLPCSPFCMGWGGLAESNSTSPPVAHAKDSYALTPSQGQIQSRHRATTCRYAGVSPARLHPQGTPAIGVAVG